MLIRIATLADINTITDLAVGFRKSLQKDFPTVEQFSGGVKKLMEGYDAEFFISFSQNNNASGYILQRYYYSMWLPGYEARIEDLYVDSDFRGMGIGKKLTEFSISRAREKGCLSVYLDTNENNIASNKIYTQLGFNSHSKRWNGRQIFYRLPLNS